MHLPAVVIGAGHSGLAMSRRLTERSIDHVVIERGEVANSWRTQRWDSLRLLTPNWHASLPGGAAGGHHPDGYMTVDEVAVLIERYATTVDAPVVDRTTVTRLGASRDGYEVVTDRGVWTCAAAVIASGGCVEASVPAFAAALPPSITSVTPLAYRTPRSLPRGGVLVVGASATGVQLAEEVRASGRPVTLAVGEHVRMPRTYRGRDIFWWTETAGILDERYDEVDDLVRARHLPSPQLIGTPQRRSIDLNSLRDAGVRVVGRLGRIDGGIAQFSGGLANVCALADLKLDRLLRDARRHRHRHGVRRRGRSARAVRTDTPPRSPVSELDLAADGIRTVIWATGYRPDHRWVDLPVFDHRGRIRHRGGVVAPGLYVLGLNVLRRRRSSFIGGAAGDTEELADHLHRHLDLTTNTRPTSIAGAVRHDRALRRPQPERGDTMNIRTTSRVTWVAGMLVPLALVATFTKPAAAHGGEQQERFLYVSTIAQSDSDPDFVAVIGADPDEPDFGQIVNRVDMPNVGDELHHFGYSADQHRLIVPGLFSSRIHIFDIDSDGSTMTLSVVNEDLVADSGYAVPHGVMAMHGMVLAPMIGAANEQTQPGGIVQIDDHTGEFVDYFGPAPERGADESGPTYMYDFAMTPDGERAISTTFGSPALCAAGHRPDLPRRRSRRLGRSRRAGDPDRQTLGANSGALMVRFLHEPGCGGRSSTPRAPSAVWLADDDDGDGVFDFQQVLGADDGLELPMDMLVSYDGSYLYVTNWFANTVQQFDISDPFHPTLQSTVSVPHPNMLRLSPDGNRLYVTNSLLTPWDNDPDFGEPRNSDYGIWLFEVGSAGDLTPLHADGSAWVSFANVEKQTTTGPAGPHMMLFDPNVPLEAGEH